ncbi:sigma-70 family RNA polymerase sigma factor [Saccharopolyspora sp. HNM0983]|uniref:RNA polymerase sigma factor n=1 Tax=Saccharopolyspora montiporae TaxID=2781240 RepID=A0A929BCX0_9PSEU|nr:sigma-70 family RNA polymerase sigma factor [Saccharopolyspora sp. HNM0983]MBE9375207.1 sigma-70 family RNA polymerase sigma factor [Saccharopolyspora sp. HNM0983]
MAQDRVPEEFIRLADPYRKELLAHCYRMTGSLHEAEDLVQETYLRAWRGYDRFEGRSSLRTWLHRIATSTCLTALDRRSRRPLPSGLGAATSSPDGRLRERPDIAWLEPVPDARIADDPTDPATIAGGRERTRLAFTAALQHLPARQRAVLLLRDVLKCKAPEVADLLGTTVTAVNSALQRARAQLARIAPAEDDPPTALTEEQQHLLDRYVTAFEAKDVGELVHLFTHDATWEMPPFSTWVRGAAAIGVLIDRQCPAGPGEMHLVPTRANGQIAFAVYRRSADGVFRPFQLQVLALAGSGVQHTAAFFDTTLFALFGLPSTAEPTAAPAH